MAKDGGSKKHPVFNCGLWTSDKKCSLYCLVEHDDIHVIYNYGTGIRENRNI